MEYVIYIGSGFFWSDVEDKPVQTKNPETYLTTAAANKSLRDCIRNMNGRGDAIQASYKPMVRPVLSINPVVFAPDQIKGEQKDLFDNQISMFD